MQTYSTDQTALNNGVYHYEDILSHYVTLKYCSCPKKLLGSYSMLAALNWMYMNSTGSSKTQEVLRSDLAVIFGKPFMMCAHNFQGSLLQHWDIFLQMKTDLDAK